LVRPASGTIFALLSGRSLHKSFKVRATEQNPITDADGLDFPHSHQLLD
jgi:hypothetical protein